MTLAAVKRYLTQVGDYLYRDETPRSEEKT